MFSSAIADIVVSAGGAATVYLTHGISRKPNGYLVALKYTPGTLAAATDLEITGESSGIPILTITDAGADVVFYYPRALNNAVADGAVGATNSEFIPIKDERIKVVVAQGGNATAGSIEAIFMTHSPY